MPVVPASGADVLRDQAGLWSRWDILGAIHTSLCMYLADLCRAQPQGWAKAAGAGWLSAPCACDRRAGCVCWERGLPGNTSSASLLTASEEPSCSSLTSLRPSYQHDRSSSKISKQNLGDSHQITSFKR